MFYTGGVGFDHIRGFVRDDDDHVSYLRVCNKEFRAIQFARRTGDAQVFHFPRACGFKKCDSGPGVA